jgi:molecular chaperone DnaK
MIQPMLEHTANLCRDALREAGLKAADIDEVVPVGGQTRTPEVLGAIKKIFGREPNRSVNPDEVVGVGAAIQTGILQGEVTDLVLLDVTPHTLGIQTKDGTFTPVIEGNANIPTKNSRLFSTVVDNQPEVEVHVLQGEGSLAEENTSLARFRLGRLSPAPAGKPQIEVTFEIDVNGILQVTARDEATGRQQNLTVRASSGLTRSEVETARIRVEGHAGYERRERNRLDAQLLGVLFGTRKTLERIRAKLTDEERVSAERTIRKAGAVREGSLEEIEDALANLERVAKMLARAWLRL